MANLYDSTTPPRTGAPEPPAGGLAGPGGYVGAIWSSLGETWGRIAKRISFWSVISLVAILTTIYYYGFAESMYDSQAILSIQNKGSTGGVGSILSSTLGTSGSSSESQQIYEYIYSMDMLKILDKKYNLREVYSDSSRNPFWKLYFPQTDENFLGFYQHSVALHCT